MIMESNRDFLPQKGHYNNLVCYKKSEVIFDLTYYFVQKWLSKGDRTVDQMIQAARSGKQNIAEGSAASTTSSETELKLINVAKASLQELLVDYQDYLRVRNLPLWQQGSAAFEQVRKIGREHNDAAFYRQYFGRWTDVQAANVAIILIKQTDYLLFKLIERLKADFLKNGGIREQMSAARRQARNDHNKPTQ